MSLDLAASATRADPRGFHMAFTLASRATVVTLNGRIDASATGPLCDALVQQVRGGCRHLVIELGPHCQLTRPGLRGLVVAAKLLQSRQGQLLICGAKASTRAFVTRESFAHLLRFAPDLMAALAALSSKDFQK